METASGRSAAGRISAEGWGRGGRAGLGQLLAQVLLTLGLVAEDDRAPEQGAWQLLAASRQVGGRGAQHKGNGRDFRFRRADLIRCVVDGIRARRNTALLILAELSASGENG